MEPEFELNTGLRPFFIYGVKFNENIYEYFQDIKYRHECENEKCLDCGLCYDDIYDFFNNTIGIEIYQYINLSSYYYIGLSPRYCKNNEMMSDFKKQVRKKVNSFTVRYIPEEKFKFYQGIVYGNDKNIQ